jgi:hypothetical protein
MASGFHFVVTQRIQKAATPTGMSGFITIDMRKRKIERAKQVPGEQQTSTMAVCRLLE